MIDEWDDSNTEKGDELVQTTKKPGRSRSKKVNTKPTEFKDFKKQWWVLTIFWMWKS